MVCHREHQSSCSYPNHSDPLLCCQSSQLLLSSWPQQWRPRWPRPGEGWWPGARGTLDSDRRTGNHWPGTRSSLHTSHSQTRSCWCWGCSSTSVEDTCWGWSRDTEDRSRCSTAEALVAETIKYDHEINIITDLAKPPKQSKEATIW